MSYSFDRNDSHSIMYHRIPPGTSRPYHYHPVQQLVPVYDVADDAYHESLLKRRLSHSNNRARLSKSLSTGNLRQTYQQQVIHPEPYTDEVYNWYYQQYYEPQYGFSTKNATLKKKKKKRTKSRKHDGEQEDIDTAATRSDDDSNKYNIDPNVYTDIDGEPMNELELLAAKNAILNETIFYNEKTDSAKTGSTNSEAADEQQLKSRALRKGVRSIDDDMVDDNLLNAIKALNLNHSVATEEIPTVSDHSSRDEEVPPLKAANHVSSNSVSSPNSGPANATAAATTAKKKRWPLSFLFKKGRLLPVAAMNQQQLQQTNANLMMQSSTSTPPTPALSPDYYSQKYGTIAPTSTTVSHHSYDASTLSLSSTRSSLLSVSPFQQQQQRQFSPNTAIVDKSISDTTSAKMHDTPPTGCWLFRFPAPVPSLTPDVWFQFDLENQKKISEYINSVSLQANTYPLHHPPSVYNQQHTLLYTQRPPPSSSLHMLQITDSHIGKGRVPIVILPFQKIAYYSIDTHVNHLACLELKYALTPYKSNKNSTA